jgi:hypothetical protein
MTAGLGWGVDRTEPGDTFDGRSASDQAGRLAVGLPEPEPLFLDECATPGAGLDRRISCLQDHLLDPLGDQPVVVAAGKSGQSFHRLRAEILQAIKASPVNLHRLLADSNRPLGREVFEQDGMPDWISL